MDDKPVGIPHSLSTDPGDNASTTSSRTVTRPPPGLPPDRLHKPVRISHSPSTDPGDDASTTSSRTVTRPPPGLPSDGLHKNLQRSKFGFAFEKELFVSCVYRKPLYSDSRLSVVTSAARTTASSVLSALSLTDVSNISILAVPIYASETSNQDRYTFGDFSWDPSNMAAAMSQQTALQSQKNALKANRWVGFANAVSRRRLDKASNLGTSQLSKKYVTITLQRPGGQMYEFCSVPVCIAEIGCFLKDKGLEVENIFCVSGSPLRLQNLQDSFNKPPRYGYGMDWSGYTVHDAASTMLRFLNRLPEPVIPPERYEAFLNASKKPFLECKWSTVSLSMVPPSRKGELLADEYKRNIAILPVASRHLLLYLLDMFAVIAYSESNKMTSSRIARVFQPAILSPVKAGEHLIEEDTGPSQCVLTF